MLEREIGSGGMARVFLGRDAVLERPVAIKILKPGHDDTDIAARFRREGRTSARLSHPNIVQVYDAGEDDFEGRKASYIVMEYVPGGDLKRLIDGKGRLSNEELARLGMGVAAGLAHAHEGGIVHRDVKPHNVLLDERARPKLSDFGIARALDATQATRTGAYLGTALYSSPEQLRGERVTPKSDVYSLGVTFYQAATGKTPFVGSPITVAHQHVSREPTPPKELNDSVSEDLDALILDCMSKTPESRPTADDVRIRLLEADRGTYPTRAAAAAPAAPKTPPATGRNTRAAQTGAPPIAPPVGERREDHRRGRGPLLLAAAALLLVLLGVAAAYASLDNGQDPNTGQSPSPNNQPAEDQQANQPEGEGQGSGSQDPAPAPEPQEQQPQEQQPQQQQPAEDPPAGGGQGDGGSVGGSDDTLSEEAAAQVVEQVYEAAESEDYEASYQLLSQGFRQREGVNSAEAWSAIFETLESISFEEGPDAQVSGNTATVTGVTIAEHTNRTERNTASWTLVAEGGEWKLDSLAIENQELL